MPHMNYTMQNCHSENTVHKYATNFVISDEITPGRKHGEKSLYFTEDFPKLQGFYHRFPILPRDQISISFSTMTMAATGKESQGSGELSTGRELQIYWLRRS
ncbi:hypothetical protein AALP_AA4G100800 [Arabis alpina]|uniref:Uncharacterized protein n=1 Tax=Arabis alpina TaxID=50452 RepID=A0A087H2B9_ARAAL|nr:hypothetical protein AALP_AA4G100800 [Arabis alpina]